MRIQFYTRPNCSLCDEAKLMLQLVNDEIDFEIEHINIEKDDQIHKKYLLRIPVIEQNGQVIQEGRVDYPTLLEALS